MAWTCPECGSDSHDDLQKCQCGYVLQQSFEPVKQDVQRSGDGRKAFVVIMLTAIANTVVTFKFNDFVPNSYTIPYYLGSAIGGVLFLFLIFILPAIAFNYFSKKNKTSYSKVSLKVAYFTAAFSVLLMMGQIYGYNKDAMRVTKKAPTSDADKRTPVFVAITTQTSEGLTDANLDQAVLMNIEGWLIKTMLQKAKIHYAESGNDPKNFNPRINARSVYMTVDGKKLAVIKIDFDNTVRSANIMGIRGNEFVRVSCIRTSNDDILIFSGECGNKIKEAFGVSLPPS